MYGGKRVRKAAIDGAAARRAEPRGSHPAPKNHKKTPSLFRPRVCFMVPRGGIEPPTRGFRSEERRVGKEGRQRGGTKPDKKRRRNELTYETQNEHRRGYGKGSQQAQDQ